MKQPKLEYLEKVSTLSEEEREKLSSRMKGKLPRRLDREKISIDEALALQMELEDEQLEEWRDNMNLVRKRGKEDRK